MQHSRPTSGLLALLSCCLCFSATLSASVHVRAVGETAVGEALLRKPGQRGAFLLDPHQGGRARKLQLEEVVYGRLVDVHALDPQGRVDPNPVFRDFLVGESVGSDGVDYLLRTSPSTQVAHLVILRRLDAPEPSPGAGTFLTLLRAAERAAAPVEPRAASASLLTTVPRNAALGLRFNDLLEDGPSATLELAETVRLVLTQDGRPLSARVLFDRHHGGSAGGFHPTRVLIDPSVSDFEARQSSSPLAVNTLGLPPGSPEASVVVRLASQVAPGSGQFTRLTNLAGRGLAAEAGAPHDPASATGDVVRALRPGNPLDPNSGFLLDDQAPVVLGEFPLSVTQVQPDPSGALGFDFLVDWVFLTSCALRPRLGDALEIGDLTLELVANGPLLNPGGIQGARVHLAQAAPAMPDELLGNGSLVARLRRNLSDSPCWFHLLPAPSHPPGAGLSTTTRFGLRFSEPMDLDSLDAFENFRAVLGAGPANAQSLVVATLLPSPDQEAVALLPLLPLAHTEGEATLYRIEALAGAAGPRDLAGNPLPSAPASKVRVASDEATETSAGLVLRFASLDEVPGPGADLRGNIAHDLSSGTVRGRPPVFFSASADRSQPVPSLMVPLPPGVQAPLSPLGSKLHSLWRYCDLGWSVRDESKFDVDVVGIAWAPLGGFVISDFFPLFEIRLAHARKLPDERVDFTLLPRYPNSGLGGRTVPFDDNLLQDPVGAQTVVHDRALGYTVSAADLFVSPTGVPLLPLPLNQGGGPLQSYTWRDTRILATGGPGGAGIPLDIESGSPLFLEPASGAVAPAGQVPSIGLPLLMEYRCYPTDVGLGLNAFDVSLAINSSAMPAFRSQSTGGINSAGQPVVRDPDSQTFPSGGFNPVSMPPGQPTAFAEDNVTYIGQLDLVHRVSRAHSAWFRTSSRSPDYFGLVLDARQDGAARVLVEVRGATGFAGTGGLESDAEALDAYGELPQGQVLFLGDDARWHTSIDEVDGAPFLQLRLTFQNDLVTGASPELDALAIAFRH